MERLLWLSLALAACYTPPEPDCGFVCGKHGECPADYACHPADNRCHRSGSPATTQCASFLDAFVPPPDAPDQIAPMVVSVSPGNGGTGLGVSSPVSATFSEDVVGVSASTFQLFQGGVQVGGTVVYMAGTHVATFDPSEQLAANTPVMGVISPPIRDVAGNALAAPYTWQFTTGADHIAPMTVSTAPFGNQVGVPVTTAIRVTFDEPVIGVDATSFAVTVAGAPIAGTFATGSNGRLVVFTPDADLPAASAVVVTLTSAITDAAGNPLAGLVFSFETI